MTVRRHSALCRVRTGAKRDGTLVAKQAEVFLNTGAFAELGPVVTSRTLTRILGPYRLPHIRVESHCVYTNTVSAASFRSIGGPQTAWANESQMDILADELGLDPLAFRLKNLLHRGEELKPGGKPLDADLREGLRRVTDRMGWQGLAAPTGAGRGLAFGVTDPGAPLASTSTVHALSDGSVVVLIGTSEIGQGSRTVMSQIVAEELCVSLERVRVRPPDTAYTPYDRSTGSSRSTTVMGKATQLAAADAREQILELAMEHFEAPAGGHRACGRRGPGGRPERLLRRAHPHAFRHAGRRDRGPGLRPQRHGHDPLQFPSSGRLASAPSSSTWTGTRVRSGLSATSWPPTWARRSIRSSARVRTRGPP